MRSVIVYIVLFFVYVFAQVLLLKNLVLFNTAFCFLYVAFIIILPVDVSNVRLMFIGFVLGLMIDTFYSSMGIHAFATVFISFLRNYWLGAITPQGGYDSGEAPSISANGILWFLVYAAPLVLIHHIFLFFLEASGFNMMQFTLLKIMASFLFTMIILVLLQLMVPQRRKL